MPNKFTNFTLSTVYAKTVHGIYIKYEKMLVDKCGERLIYCTYSLNSPKDTSCHSIDCYVLQLPMTILEGGVEVNHESMVHKINSKHYKKVDYDELTLEFNRDFSIFL